MYLQALPYFSMGVLALKANGKHVYLFVLLIVALVVGLRTGNRVAQKKAVQAAASAQSEVYVLIDPGHGGEDGGAVGVSGVQESTLNLEISQRVRAMMRLMGLEVRMTRETDVSIHDPEAKSISEKKISDLHNRAAQANEYPNTFLLSIHQNFFPEGKYRGAQCFYAPTGNSQQLAEQLQRVIREHLDPDNRREAKPVDPSVYLMNHIRSAGVLIECGFLSNGEEEALLCQEEYQKKLAAVIATVTVKYLEDSDEV